METVGGLQGSRTAERVGALEQSVKSYGPSGSRPVQKQISKNSISHLVVTHTNNYILL